MRRWLILAAALMLVLTACEQRDVEPAADDDLSGPVTRTVQVDASPDAYKGFALAYFPQEVTVRPGDTVSFKQTWTGEPHSVTLGSLIDETVGRYREVGPEEMTDEENEKGEALPVMLPEGPGDANQIAVNPCYVDEAPLPTDTEEPCPDQDQPEFDGTQAYYSSGFIPSDGDYEVPLADDIEPGTYAFYCNLHGPDMSGEINVVDADTDIPSQADVDEVAKEEMEKAFAPTTRAYESAVEGDTPYDALAGFGSPEAQATSIAEFIPEEIEVETGDEVTWTVFGPHTITFNAPEDVGHPLVRAQDGTWHVNEKSFAPAGGPGAPPPPEDEGSEEGEDAEEEPEGTPGPPPEPTNVDGGSWDGESYKSSGFFLSFPEPGSFFSYSVTFEEAGDYRYVCLVHPAMTGTVKVT